MLIFDHDAYRAHETPGGHPENAHRHAGVLAALRASGFANLQWRESPRADKSHLMLVHDEAYIDAIYAAAPDERSGGGLVQLDADTFIGPSSLEAGERAVGGAVAAVDAIAAGQARRAFVPMRPPGHHAEPARAMGFGFFNAAAIAAFHARAALGVSRVAVVDFDVHHGNGVEAAFWHDANAFYGSSHEWPQYPGTGRASDRGADGNIVNAPLPTGAGGREFRAAWAGTILPALKDFSPEFIVVCAGFDAHKADPVGGLALLEDDFGWVTREIVAVAKTYGDGRIVSVLEGGYNLAALARSVVAHVNALMDE
ncbi:MAG: histone deacetylase family protein [Parvularculaceae bacterium]